MKLRILAKPRILCHVNSGSMASFWHDNWTGLGSLIDITGELGPQVSGISIDSSVAEAVAAGAWRATRSRNPTLIIMRQSLPPQVPDITSSEPDYYLWRNSVDDPPSVFSTSKKWISLNPPPPLVAWYKAVWFSQKIPKHSFIVWLLLKERMLTRDRLRSWGLVVPVECLLCGHAVETTLHLYFDCHFSSTVWRVMLSNLRLPFPTRLAEIVPWLISSPMHKKIKIILKLVFQAVVYFIWRERNSCLHPGPHKPPSLIVKEIQLQVRAKLLGLDRDRITTIASQRRNELSFLSTWFDRFQA